MWTEVESTADKAIQVNADLLIDLFAQATYGMIGVMSEYDVDADHDDVEKVMDLYIAVEADDLETLLVEWLNEILYQADKHDILPYAVIMRDVGCGKVRCTASAAVIFSTWRVHKGAAIKAATFHDLKIAGDNNEGYSVKITFDV